MDQIPADTTDPLEKERRSTLQEVFWACKVALDTLNDLLLFDKLQNGLVKLIKEKLVVMDFMPKDISMFSVQLRSKRLQLTFSTPGVDYSNHSASNATNPGQVADLSSTNMISSFDVIEADKIKFGQVVRNLISNAIKFTSDGGDIQVSVQSNPATLSDEQDSHVNKKQ